MAKEGEITLVNTSPVCYNLQEKSLYRKSINATNKDRKK